MIGGKLKLKGKFQARQDKVERKLRDQLDEEEHAQKDEQFIVKLKHNNNPEDRERIIINKPLCEGKGLVMSSGRTIHGQNSDFTKQMEAGDYVLVQNSQNEDETRQILTIFSSRSMMIDQPFSVDLITFKPFRYRKKPTMKESLTLEESMEDRYSDVIKKSQNDNNSILEYRERKGMWGYKTIKVDLGKEVSREDLLQLRTKKNRDKFCWY